VTVAEGLTSASRCDSAGKPFHHSAATTQVPTPPSTTEPTGPSQRRGGARFKFAQLVAGADEDRVDGADAAAHVVGRLQLHQGLADDHAHHVGRAAHGQHQQRQPK
jgi:hypothetical protein